MTQPGLKSLLLIDSATSGCAGAYIDALHANLDGQEAVEVAVSHYFPHPYGKKIFYKFSELAAQQRYRLGRARLYVRFAELVWTFLRLLLYVRRARIRVVCYALSSNLLLEYLFLAAVQWFGRAHVYLICHDVIPFTMPNEDLGAKIQKRARFYRLADRLIVHNDNSVHDLREAFGISGSKVARFPFPLYTPDQLGTPQPHAMTGTRSKRFLFVGHLRPEKGIDTLLEAWPGFFRRNPDCELVVAGTIPRGCSYDFAPLQSSNLRVIDRYLTDEEYVGLIAGADCVVLPYLRGTNSGVVMTVIGLRRNLIVSDIEMFRNNPLIPPQSFFRQGDSASLEERLAHFSSLDSNAQALASDAEHRSEAYQREFRSALNSVFGHAVFGGRA